MMSLRSGCRIRRGAVLSLLILVSSAWAVEARSPLEVIQSGTDRAIEILRSAQTGRGPTLRQRRAEILVIVDDYFNFDEMAMRALGRPWRDQSPSNREEFVRLFKQLLFNTYVERVETYTMGNETVVYDSEEIRGRHALVKTRVLNYKNTNVDVDYLLRLDNNKWRVYDVIVEGISLVNNYRSQFSSLLANRSFEDLLQILQQRVDQQLGV